MPLLRTGLAYPAGIKAGFDPSHIAVQGQVTGRIFSAVAHNRNMVSLLRGLPGALGATAITFGMDGIAGPTAVFTDNSTTCTTGFSGHTTGTDAVCTMAYIGVFPSAPTATAVLNSSNASNRMAMGIVGGFYNVYVGTAFTDVSSGIPVLTGAPFFLCCSLRTGASNFVLVNLATGKVTTAISATAFTNNTTDGIFQVGANSQVNSTNLNLSAVMYSPKSMNMSQLLKWAADPWSFWYPQQARSKLGSGVNAYTLTAAAGTYAFTGTAATLTHKYVVSAAAGAYTLTGTAATLRRNLPLIAGAGSYTLTGSAASLLHKYILAAGAGSYAMTGTPATLKHGFAVAAGAGSYALTGTAASLRKTWLLGAGAGSYLFTGTAVTLTKASLSTYTLAAGAGAYVFTGTAASLLHKYIVTAGAGSYTFAGSDAILVKGAARNTGGWDTSDPVFYDWWRNRAKEERKKLEAIKAAPVRAAKVAKPALREETIEAIEVAQSIDEIQAIDMLRSERAVLKKIIAEYQDVLDEEEALLLALLH